VKHTWERQELYTKFWLENLKGIDHLEDVGIDGRIILEWSLGNQGVSCELDSCGSGEDEWQALMNMIMNLCVKRWEIFWLAE
jgi:hypothetical protein